MQVNKVKASLNNYRQSPHKVREMAGLIRGKMTNEADIILQGINKSGSQEMRKLIKSAIANAQNNFNLNKDDLYISEIKVDEAPVMKRFRARAFGRAAQILKRSCHINVVLDSVSGEKEAKKDEEDKKLKNTKAGKEESSGETKNQGRAGQGDESGKADKVK